jgi:hypothetical protein
MKLILLIALLYTVMAADSKDLPTESIDEAKERLAKDYMEGKTKPLTGIGKSGNKRELSQTEKDYY